MSNEKPSRFKRLIVIYEHSIFAYGEFLDLVAAALGELGRDYSSVVLQLIDPIIQGVIADGGTPEDLRTIQRALIALGEQLREEHQEETPDSGEAEIRQEDAGLEEKSPARTADLPPAVVNERDSGKREFAISDEAALALLRIMNVLRWHVPPALHEELLFRGILTGLVGQFEVLIGDIAHAFYARAPGAVETTDKVLSVEELRSFSSVEAALEYVIEQKVDDLLRGSPIDWCRFFEKLMGVDLKAASPEWERFNEYIQRRHIIVHANGRITRRYLAQVHDELIEEYFGKPDIGHRSRLNEEYVRAALTHFEITGLRLAFECWCKLHPEEDERLSERVLDCVYRALLRQKWKTAHDLGCWGSAKAQFTQATRTVCQINAWLAAKRMGRWGEVEASARAFDASALHPRFAAARAALIGDADGFFEIVDGTDGAGLDVRAWREWPVFDEIRCDPRFPEYAKRYTKRPANRSGNDGDEEVGDGETQ